MRLISGRIRIVGDNIMSTKTIGRFGQLDAVINNAGIGMIGKFNVEMLPLEEWNRVLGINLTGCFLMAKYAALFLRKSRGAIVNIASTRAQMSEPDSEAYAASKGGVVALTHALAVSLGPEVRVNCVTGQNFTVDGGMTKKMIYEK